MKWLLEREDEEAGNDPPKGTQVEGDDTDEDDDEESVSGAGKESSL